MTTLEPADDFKPTIIEAHVVTQSDIDKADKELLKDLEELYEDDF